MSKRGPTDRTSSGFKRPIIGAASVFGIRPANPKWVPALLGLRGSFERTGSELAIFVAVSVWISGVVAILTPASIEQYRHWGWTQGTTIFAIYASCMLCLLYFLVTRAQLRYVFDEGKVSAFNSWGRMLWSEDLTGLK